MFYGVYIDIHTMKFEGEKILEDWKQAAALAKFELRNSKRALITLVVMLITYAFLMIYSAPMLVETIIYDLFFLIFIGMAASWAKPKDFQINKMWNGLWGTPYFSLLHQLPIRKEILIKNRFVIYYAYSIPFHALFLISIYAFSSSIRTILTFPEYTAFTIIWLSFGIYWGTVFPLSDLGEIRETSTFKISLYIILYFGLIIGGVFTVELFTGYGVVYSSMMLAKKWPLLSSLLSIILAFVCTVIALRQANKKIMKIDY